MVPKTIIFHLLFLLIVTSEPIAGTLDDFEKVATNKRDGTSSSTTRSNDDSDDNSPCLGAIAELLVEAVFLGTIAGISYLGNISMERAGSDTGWTSKEKEIITPREKGEALIPNLRFDYSWQNASNDIHANDFRFEAGYGAFGFQARKTQFSEQSQNDNLGMTYIHGLLRLSAGNHFEIDPGIGRIELDGNDDNTGFSFTLPVLIHPSKHLGFECRPTWSKINNNSIRDIDIAILTGTDYVSLKAGYRSLRTGGENIEGPYVGISIRY